MLDQSQQKLRTVLARRDTGRRWRGQEITRVEGLSDAVFAFAITLLVVSLELPKTFAHETYGVTRHHVAMMLIGILSLLLAWLGRPALSGMVYFMTSPVMGVLGYVHGRRRKTLIAERDRVPEARTA